MCLLLALRTPKSYALELQIYSDAAAFMLLPGNVPRTPSARILLRIAGRTTPFVGSGHSVPPLCYSSHKPLITSNLPFSEWGSIFQGDRMTAALLDRLTHRCTIFEMNGESYRFRESVKSAKTTKEKKTQEG
jgi:hypothetical protein